MAIDPPYRLDPFANIVNVHWGEEQTTSSTDQGEYAGTRGAMITIYFVITELQPTHFCQDEQPVCCIIEGCLGGAYPYCGDGTENPTVSSQISSTTSVNYEENRTTESGPSGTGPIISPPSMEVGSGSLTLTVPLPICGSPQCGVYQIGAFGNSYLYAYGGSTSAARTETLPGSYTTSGTGYHDGKYRSFTTTWTIGECTYSGLSYNMFSAYAQANFEYVGSRRWGN